MEDVDDHHGLERLVGERQRHAVVELDVDRARRARHHVDARNPRRADHPAEPALRLLDLSPGLRPHDDREGRGDPETRHGDDAQHQDRHRPGVIGNDRREGALRERHPRLVGHGQDSPRPHPPPRNRKACRQTKAGPTEDNRAGRGGRQRVAAATEAGRAARGDVGSEATGGAERRKSGEGAAAATRSTATAAKNAGSPPSREAWRGSGVFETTC